MQIINLEMDKVYKNSHHSRKLILLHAANNMFTKINTQLYSFFLIDQANVYNPVINMQTQNTPL